jgi:hypothetical protein
MSGAAATDVGELVFVRSSLGIKSAVRARSAKMAGLHRAWFSTFWFEALLGSIPIVGTIFHVFSGADQRTRIAAKAEATTHRYLQYDS